MITYLKNLIIGKVHENNQLLAERTNTRPRAKRKYHAEEIAETWRLIKNGI